MIKSIFGLTTEDVRQQQVEQQRDFAKQLQASGYSPLEAQLGTALGTGLARGLMSKLGYEDPAIVKAQEAEARQEALNEQLASMSPDDPRGMYLVGQMLLPYDPETAGRFISLASDLDKQQREQSRLDSNIGRAPRVEEVTDASGNLLGTNVYTYDETGKANRNFVSSGQSNDVMSLINALQVGENANQPLYGSEVQKSLDEARKSNQ